MNQFAVIASPIGALWITADGAALTGLYMDVPEAAQPGAVPSGGGAPEPGWTEAPAAAPLAAAARQLAEYFDGSRRSFDLPLAWRGTPFQESVWRALTAIPYGATVSYGELARRVGNPRASRAVGMANNRNPLSIFVPCHRVIGADGSLTGYGGGIERKRWLLAHEGRSPA
jgi:methylated-DNA-[protein]-cysteine S-methyltransferase